jgi:hypothetical protein
LQIDKAILSKQSNPGGITIPNFKPYYTAIAIEQHGIDRKTDVKTSGTESGPRYESTQLCPPYFLQRHPKYTMEER